MGKSLISWEFQGTYRIFEKNFSHNKLILKETGAINQIHYYKQVDGKYSLDKNLINNTFNGENNSKK